MSYILDALKRAERERKQGQVSVLDEIPATPVAEPRRRLPPLLIPVASGVVAVAALGFALLAWRHHGGGNPGPVHTPPAAVAPPVAPPTPPVAAAQPLSPPAPPAATIEDGGKLATLDDVYQAPPGPPPGAPPAGQAVPPPGPPPAAMRGPRSAPPDTQAPPPGQDAAPDAAPATDVAAPADAAQQDLAPPSPPPVQQQPDSPAQRQLREMPESYRSNFPAFTVDVHAYNSNPSRRFVLIGGKRYHEGDTLTEGPRILGIVPDGIVFDWQGQQVLYAISR